MIAVHKCWHLRVSLMRALRLTANEPRGQQECVYVDSLMGVGCTRRPIHVSVKQGTRGTLRAHSHGIWTHVIRSLAMSKRLNG